MTPKGIAGHLLFRFACHKLRWMLHSDKLFMNCDNIFRGLTMRARSRYIIMEIPYYVLNGDYFRPIICYVIEISKMCTERTVVINNGNRVETFAYNSS